MYVLIIQFFINTTSHTESFIIFLSKYSLLHPNVCNCLIFRLFSVIIKLFDSSGLKVYHMTKDQ